MDITYVNGSYLKEISYRAENVHVVEGVEENHYGKTPEGRTDFKKRIASCIKDDVIAKFLNIIDELIWNRHYEYDSSDSIKLLFSKLPPEKMQEVLKELNETYGNNEG